MSNGLFRYVGFFCFSLIFMKAFFLKIFEIQSMTEMNSIVFCLFSVTIQGVKALISVDCPSSVHCTRLSINFQNRPLFPVSSAIEMEIANGYTVPTPPFTDSIRQLPPIHHVTLRHATSREFTPVSLAWCLVPSGSDVRARRFRHISAKAVIDGHSTGGDTVPYFLFILRLSVRFSHAVFGRKHIHTVFGREKNQPLSELFRSS